MIIYDMPKGGGLASYAFSNSLTDEEIRWLKKEVGVKLVWDVWPYNPKLKWVTQLKINAFTLSEQADDKLKAWSEEAGRSSSACFIAWRITHWRLNLIKRLGGIQAVLDTRNKVVIVPPPPKYPEGRLTRNDYGYLYDGVRTPYGTYV
jgi:hypothetical protein